MPLQNITYQTLTDIALNYILNNCANIDSKFSSMAAEFKAGYHQNVRYAGQADFYSYYDITISRYVSKISSTTVRNDFTAFLQRVGLNTKLTENVSEKEYIDVINNLVNFCSTKCCYTVSQFSKNKYLIYYNNTNFLHTYIISEAIGKKLAAAQDVNDILINLIDTINQTLRVIPCKYTFKVY